MLKMTEITQNRQKRFIFIVVPQLRDANGQDLSTLVLRQLKVLTNSEAATRGVLCKKVFL